MIAAAPFAQIGMGLGVFFKTTDKNLKTLAGSGLLPGGLAGTTEIITYGILVRYKRTMVIVAIAGAIGGAINGALGVKGNWICSPKFLVYSCLYTNESIFNWYVNGLSFNNGPYTCIWI